MNTKLCTKCKVDKPKEDFPNRTSGGKTYLHSFCRICKNAERKKYAKNEPPEYSRNYQRARRLDPAKRPYHILIDSRKNDKKKGFENDLDLEFITSAIEKPCAYCGEGAILKSLDRIDNLLGHLKTNVVVSCKRCNLTRGNMPYEAWLCVAEGMRVARERRLFGEWDGKRLQGKRNIEQ